VGRVGIFGFFTLGIWAWAPVWLLELFPTRMRGTAVAFCFNAPRFISCLGPLIAGTLIAYFGGFGPAATIVGLFFILGVVAAPFLPRPTASRCRTRFGKRLGRHRRRPRHSSAQHQPHSGYASSDRRSRLTRAVGPLPAARAPALQ
jgi:MFS family permease